MPSRSQNTNCLEISLHTASLHVGLFHFMTHQDRDVTSRQVLWQLCHFKLRYFTSHQVPERHITVNHATSRHITSSPWTSCHFKSRQFMSRQAPERPITVNHATSRHITSSPWTLRPYKSRQFMSRHFVRHCFVSLCLIPVFSPVSFPGSLSSTYHS